MTLTVTEDSDDNIRKILTLEAKITQERRRLAVRSRRRKSREVCYL